MDVRFVDTTFRDGSQSLWALGLRTGMMEAVADDMARAGFDVIEVPVGGLYFKKFIRDLKENPWDMARMLVAKMPGAVKACMAGGGFSPFESPPPHAVIELFYARLAHIGVLNRAQSTANSADQPKRLYPWLLPIHRKNGTQVVLALSYTISPRHTDDYYAEKTREILAFEPDVIYLKDQGGLLTVDRIRTLLPAIVEAAGKTKVELHSHCTTGQADLVYLEALGLGIDTVHTAVPPLAEGSSQPSVLNVAENARQLGFTPHFDEKITRSIAERLTQFARQDGLPIGGPTRYEYSQYVHQVPGGVISNLVHQLAEMRLQDRVDDVLAETVEVRKDMGYPIMITPHSQFVVTQSAINVATGERYKVVIDELILFALGSYGEDSGYPWMDQNLRDRLSEMPRAKELAKLGGSDRADMPLKKVREAICGPEVADEEFLLRYLMKGESEIDTMHAAGPPRQYLGANTELKTLIDELGKLSDVRYVQVQRGTDRLVLQNRASEQDGRKTA